MIGWFATICLTAVGALVRLANLGEPTEHLLDEHYYPEWAGQMLRNGGVEDGLEATDPSLGMPVHPPLGSQLIALGEWILGPGPSGWRVCAALAGTLCIGLVVRIGRTLTGSTVAGCAAGILLICDGVSHVMSRVGMLDIFVTVFVLAGVAALVRDHVGVLEQCATDDLVLADATMPSRARSHCRWWRLVGAGFLGLACAVKWSGVSWLLALAAVSVFSELVLRRRARPGGSLWSWWPGALAAFAALPLVVYVATWWAWLGHPAAPDRDAVGVQIGHDGPFSFVPDALRALWYHHGQMLEAAAQVSTRYFGPSTAASRMATQPWEWPIGVRVMPFFLQTGTGGCGGPSCVRVVLLIGTPVIWLPALGVLALAISRAWVRRDGRYQFVVVSYLAGIVPWFFFVDRLKYAFYMTPTVPFLVLAGVMVAHEFVTEPRSTRGRLTRSTVAGAGVALAVANFVWLWPILDGVPITRSAWETYQLLPLWHVQE